MGKVVPLRAVEKQADPSSVADAVAAFLERDWSDNSRRSFVSDLKRLQKAFSFTRIFSSRLIAAAAWFSRKGFCNDLRIRPTEGRSLVASQ